LGCKVGGILMVFGEMVLFLGKPVHRSLKGIAMRVWRELSIYTPYSLLPSCGVTFKRGRQPLIKGRDSQPSIFCPIRQSLNLASRFRHGIFAFLHFCPDFLIFARQPRHDRLPSPTCQMGSALIARFLPMPFPFPCFPSRDEVRGRLLA
jgi:hypothetical protein